MGDTAATLRVVVFIFELFLLTVGIYLLVHVRRLSRHQPKRVDDVDAQWPDLAPFVRAWRRALPVSTTLFVMMIGAMAVLGLLQPGPLDGVGLDIVFVLAISLVGFSLAVAVFNRPRSLVAPHLRHEPGLIEDLTGRESC